MQAEGASPSLHTRKLCPFPFASVHEIQGMLLTAPRSGGAQTGVAFTVSCPQWLEISVFISSSLMAAPLVRPGYNRASSTTATSWWGPTRHLPETGMAGQFQVMAPLKGLHRIWACHGNPAKKDHRGCNFFIQVPKMECNRKCNTILTMHWHLMSSRKNQKYTVKDWKNWKKLPLTFF